PAASVCGNSQTGPLRVVPICRRRPANTGFSTQNPDINEGRFLTGLLMGEPEFAVIFLVFFLAFPGTAPPLSGQPARSNGPFVSMNEGRPVATHYFGEAAATQALAGRSAKPLSLAAADFDEAGMPALVSGYATIGGGGTLAIHRGNVDALWPYGPALRNGTPPVFLPDARAVSVPEPPDFLGAGDFDADGHWDIVTARRGSHALYLLRGNGHGEFAAAEKIDL